MRLPDKRNSRLTLSKGLWRKLAKHGQCFIFRGIRVRSTIASSTVFSGVLGNDAIAIIAEYFLFFQTRKITVCILCLGEDDVSSTLLFKHVVTDEFGSLLRG